MEKKIVSKIVLEMMDIIKGIGAVLLIMPLVLYWFIHGNEERYLWIIKGPYPFSSFGSGPVQLWMDVLAVSIGCLLIGLSVFIKKRIKVKEKIKRGNKA